MISQSVKSYVFFFVYLWPRECDLLGYFSLIAHFHNAAAKEGHGMICELSSSLSLSPLYGGESLCHIFLGCCTLNAGIAKAEREKKEEGFKCNQQSVEDRDCSIVFPLKK